LKLLYKAYFGRVKLIYIDPPYNTGNDFVYPDDFADPLGRYLEITGQKDAAGNLLTSNPETSGRYHSAWLNMMYPRLFMARQLLRDDGAIFISIADHEVQNLRLLLDEIFGSENFLTTAIWQKVFARKNSARFFSEDHEYIVAYAKNAASWEPGLLARSEESIERYQNPDNDPRGLWSSDSILVSLSSGQRGRQFQKTGTSNDIYEVTSPSGRKFSPPSGNSWRYSKERFKELDRDSRIWWGQNNDNAPRYKRFLSEVRDGVVPHTLWLHKEVGHTQEASQELKKLFGEMDEAAFPTPKPVRLMRRIIDVANVQGPEPNIVMDFFAGSCSLAHAILEANTSEGNLRFIMVQFPESLARETIIANKRVLRTIADIGKERIRRVIANTVIERKRQLPFEPNEPDGKPGFRVFKLAPSTLRAWRGTTAPTPDEYVNQLALLSEPLRDGWRAEDVVWEVAIKEGFPLTSRVTTAAAGGQEVYRVADPDSGRAFHVCLDDTVTADVAAALGLASGDLLVVRDAAVDDTTAANLALQCRLKTL